MNRRKPFTQADVARALKAAHSAGIKVQRFEIDPSTGRIVIVSIDPIESASTPLAEWRARRGSR
jgi:hypothetical protein